MAGNDPFKALTEALEQTGKRILEETTGLDQTTDSLIGQIDDTCKALPMIIYQQLEPAFISWKALLKRSDVERIRLGNVLSATGQAIAQEEQKILGQFVKK